MRKSLLLVPVLLFAACQLAAPANQPGTMTNSAASSTSSVSSVISGDIVVDWKVWPSETADDGQPHSSLFVTVGEDDIKIGDYGGTFSDLRTAGVQPEGGVLLHGQYWWAGGGDEFQVVRTEKGIDVLHRAIDEEVQPGDFQVMQSVAVSADSTVTAGPLREQY